MNRAQLEHVIRAAATIAGDTEIVVIGSQAILGRYPEAPTELGRRGELTSRPSCAGDRRNPRRRAPEERLAEGPDHGGGERLRRSKRPSFST